MRSAARLAEVRFLIAGPALFICDGCVTEVEQRVGMDPSPALPPSPACSFCKKAPPEVQRLVAGPAHWICTECLRLCRDILDEEAERKAEKK